MQRFTFFQNAKMYDRGIARKRYFRDEQNPLGYLNAFQHEGRICAADDENGVQRVFQSNRGVWTESNHGVAS